MVRTRQDGRSRWRHRALPIVMIRVLCCDLPLYTVKAVHKKVQEKAVERRTKSVETPRRSVLEFERRPFMPVSHALSENPRAFVWADQSASLLLLILPWELRRMIWEYAVGGRVLHPCICKSTGYKNVRTQYLREVKDPAWCLQRALKRGHLDKAEPLPGFLALVQTCHQIYSESINIIYANNTFDKSIGSCTQYPQLFMLTLRLNSLRTFRLAYQVYTGEILLSNSRIMTEQEYQCWEKTWNCLARLGGLRDLRVKLYGLPVDDSWLPPDGSMLLEPIKAITTPTNFELILSRPHEIRDGDPLEGSKWMELPCKVRVSYDYSHNHPARDIVYGAWGDS